MEMIFCPNCEKLTGYKRALGFGTFFAVLLAAGLWLFAIPFYPKRCITCGLGKLESVSWHRTWCLAAVLFSGGVLVVILVDGFSSGPARHTTERIKDLRGEKPAAAQSSRDDWKQPSLDLEAHLTHTLADAPITAEERAQIFRVLEDFAIAQKQNEKPETLMTARVGSIGFAEDGSQQVLVQGPYAAFCGASGNCPMWIFIRHGKQLRLALEMFGDAITMRGKFSRGLRDFATSSHFSAYEEYFSVYRSNANKYESVDCYKATFDSDHSSQPMIADCQK